jgi:2-methylcitrate dehydratase PrpD
VNELLDSVWTRFGTLEFDDIPVDVVTVAHQSILDWFGCALAGSGEPLVTILCDELAQPVGACAVVGGDQRADVYRASMINAVAGHAW